MNPSKCLVILWIQHVQLFMAIADYGSELDFDFFYITSLGNNTIAELDFTQILFVNSFLVMKYVSKNYRQHPLRITNNIIYNVKIIEVLF